MLSFRMRKRPAFRRCGLNDGIESRKAMEFSEFKELINNAPDYQKKDYKRLAKYACIGNDVWPQFQEHLEKADSLYGFFENIYYDDDCRFEKAWGMWARMKHAHEWPLRFVPIQEVHGFSFAGAVGLVVQTEGLDMMWPLQVRGGVDKYCDVYVYEDDQFNDEAVDYMLSVGGKLTVAGLELDGSYDVYRADGLLIFEKWIVDDIGRRANKKRQIWGENPNKYLYV